MSQYLLSTYAVEGEVPGAPSTPEEMQGFMQRVVALEDDMEAAARSSSAARSMTQTRQPSSASVTETSS